MSLVQTISRFYALGGENEIQLLSNSKQEGERIAEILADIVRGVESKYSRYLPDSIVSRINNAAGSGEWIEVDAETAGLIDFAGVLYQESTGLFDPTSGVLRKIWDFKVGKIPTLAERERSCALIGWERVEWDRPRIRLPVVGMEIDFGGFGKEYAADKVAAAARSLGIKSGLVNLAGDVSIIGPRVDGAMWRVGITHPRIASSVITAVELAQGAVATSGDYERYFEQDGRRYCHILNPRTGMPVEDLQSVTILSDSCLIAGGLATTAMLFGQCRAEKMFYDTNVAALLVTKAGKLREFNFRSSG